MRVTPGLALAALALSYPLMAGCGSGSPNVNATPAAEPSGPPTSTAAPESTPKTPEPEPLAPPDSPRRVVYDRELVSDPMPKSAAKVSMTASDAIKIAAEQTTISAEQQPGTPDADLRVVYAGVPSATRKLTGRPSWVLTWRNSAPAVRGPVTLTKKEREKIAAGLECVFVVTVDTGSRKSTNALQLCVRK